jgi:predicted permease
MLVVGGMLADIKIMDVFCDISLYYGTAIRLVAMPLVVLIVMKCLGVKDMFLGIPVLIAAMPAPANAAIMAEMYGGDASFASKSIFLSTVLSAVTIPLIIKLM